MRTTVIIQDELLKRAKLHAAKRNLTVSDVVNDALRQVLGRSTETAPPFNLITFGGHGKKLRHEPSDFSNQDMQDDLDGLR